MPKLFHVSSNQLVQSAQMFPVQVANLETKIQKTDEEIKSLVAKGTAPEVESRYRGMDWKATGYEMNLYRSC